MGKRIFPAEWAEQSGVQLTFPHRDTDWNPYLQEAEETFLSLAEAILQSGERLLVVCRQVDEVRRLFVQRGIGMGNVRFAEMPTDDTWARDHAPLTVYEDGVARLLDFKFNGWGLKFPASRDNLITRRAVEQGVFDAEYENHLNFVLEGGSVETDGEGTLLTTAECLCSPNRNGGYDRRQIEQYLAQALGVDRFLWLSHGALRGDDTDSHIDTLARFVARDAIAYVQADDPTDEHYEDLRQMEAELRAFKTREGHPYRLYPLPMPRAIEYEGERLPATYANFLILNKRVIVPTYGQRDKDEVAMKQLAKAFPDREIVGVDARVLIRQHGSIHCVTMQYPKGIL